MKCALAVLFLLFSSLANAVTVYYQPTPYPLYRMDGSPMPEDLTIVHVWDGWFNNSYNTSLVRDSQLQIGGWGDIYTSPIRFDLTGLPAQVDNAYLYLYALPSDSANPSQVSMWPITSDWTPSGIGAYHFPSVDTGLYWQISTVVNRFRGYQITQWYNAWRSGARSDKGILIWPYNNGDGSQQHFDKFASSRTKSDGQRPLLRLDFTPTLELKMPLPGGYSWLLTTEVGGYDCRGKMYDSSGKPMWPDPAHQGLNYFSIDLSPTGSGYSSSVPVFAAAGGKVLQVGYEKDTNGNFIVIDHDGDGNKDTGFQSRYLHLADVPKRKDGTLIVQGNIVAQGDQIGIMGNSGASDGTHLHFGVRYQDKGYSTTLALAKVIMEGKLLKSYQSECSLDSNGVSKTWIRRYPSFLTPTGK